MVIILLRRGKRREVSREFNEKCSEIYKRWYTSGIPFVRTTFIGRKFLLVN